MTKKLTTLTDQSTELNLADPTIAEMVVKANVDNSVVTPLPTVTPEKPSGKTTPFTMSLTTEQVAGLIRSSGASGVSWKDYLKARIQEDILQQKVGRAVITNPSTMNAKISAPTGSVRRG